MTADLAAIDGEALRLVRLALAGRGETMTLPADHMQSIAEYLAGEMALLLRDLSRCSGIPVDVLLDRLELHSIERHAV